jgi:hypothetical protein
MFWRKTRNQVENLRPNRVIQMSIEAHATKLTAVMTLVVVLSDIHLSPKQGFFWKNWCVAAAASSAHGIDELIAAPWSHVSISKWPTLHDRARDTAQDRDPTFAASLASTHEWPASSCSKAMYFCFSRLQRNLSRSATARR